MISLETVDRLFFAPFAGQNFLFRSRAEAWTLTLIEAKSLGGRTPGSARGPFALRFRSEPGLRLAQGIYHVQHDAAGEMEIFVVQNGDGPQGSDFEAIFN